MNEIVQCGLNFNRFKDTVVNIIWMLSILGIGIEVSPLKFNPIKSFVNFIFKPLRAIVQEELKPLKDEIKKNAAQIDQMNKRMDETERISEEEQLSSQRWKILNFGDQLRSGQEKSKEAYDYIISLHDAYSAEIKKRDISNGVMDATFAYIYERYEEHVKNNDFIG